MKSIYIKKTQNSESKRDYTRPNPLVFSIAVINLSLNFLRDEYSGNRSLLKHVNAVGNLSDKISFCIQKIFYYCYYLSLSGPFLWI